MLRSAVYSCLLGFPVTGDQTRNCGVIPHSDAPGNCRRCVSWLGLSRSLTNRHGTSQ